MKEIKLTLGQVAVIDDEDFDKISHLKWRAQKARNGFYATANLNNKDVIQMQNMIITNVPEGKMVDHRDRNGLNNQKDNLRICTPSQNGANRTPWGKSKYLGVSRKGARNKWRAFIGVEGVNKYIGTFDSEEQAAIAYNEAAIKYKGEFANLNVIQ